MFAHLILSLRIQNNTINIVSSILSTVWRSQGKHRTGVFGCGMHCMQAASLLEVCVDSFFSLQHQPFPLMCIGSLKSAADMKAYRLEIGWLVTDII